MRSGFNILLWTLILIVTALAWTTYQQGRTIKELVLVAQNQGQITRILAERIAKIEQYF